MESYKIILTKSSEVCSILYEHYGHEVANKKILSVSYGSVQHTKYERIIPAIYQNLDYYCVVIVYESKQLEYKIITA